MTAVICAVGGLAIGYLLGLCRTLGHEPDYGDHVDDMERAKAYFRQRWQQTGPSDPNAWRWDMAAGSLEEALAVTRGGL